MLTDFQQAKLERRFAQLDVDGDGFIQEADLATLAQRLCDRLIPADGVAERTEIQEGYKALWQHLAANADADGDNQISKEEYASAVETGLMTSSGRFADSVERIVMALFRSLDEDGSGTIERGELSRLGDAYGLSQKDTDELFAKLDINRDGVITMGEYLGAVNDFYYGDDPDSPGSYLFGRVA